MLITENSLDQWVRGHAEAAQSVIVELVAQLVAVSAPRPREHRFPLGDSIGQHGPDGFLDALNAFPPYVPQGKSYWEIGTDLGARRKATNDYKQRTDETPTDERLDSTFVFVTPLSGRRDWKGTWKPDGQRAWVRARERKGEWKDVRVIDCTKLVAWVHRWPAIELWLAAIVLNAPAHDLEAAGECWKWLSGISAPYALPPTLFLSDRDDATKQLMEVLHGDQNLLKLVTHFPADVVPFVAAAIASLDDPIRSEVANKTLIVASEEAWAAVAALEDPHLLVARPTLDLGDNDGVRLIQIAKNKGHSIIWGGPGSGRPEPSSVRLRTPTPDGVKRALEQAGIPAERARSLSQQSGGNLGSLLRVIQGFAAIPEWARTDEAAELAIAVLLGSWDEDSVADRATVEQLSGKTYGEWIETIRKAASRPGTPLVHKQGTWRFTSRFEAWYVLGGRVFDDHLDRFLDVARRVFAEDAPGLELPAGERYLAPLTNRKESHSQHLRHGLADALALLGSHGGALSSCSSGKPQVTAILAVRDVLSVSTWQRWASVDRLLPLFAEAAPDEFLSRLAAATESEAAPFEALFSQEGDAITGGNYVTGSLWALETLAWSPELLGRVTLCLGDLAARDPGGRWANRPANSLTTIFLPWFPQTAATKEQQRSAIDALVEEYPAVAWKVLLSLLPENHSTSMGSAKPVWRSYIPENWSEGTTWEWRWSQEEYFANAALSIAGSDPGKVADLVDHMPRLPNGAFTALLDRLGSDEVTHLPEDRRVGVWQSVANLVLTHQKFADADWAMTPERVSVLAAAAERLAPQAPMLRHRRLFTEKSVQLFEVAGDYDEQRKLLDQRRREAVREVASQGGPEAVVQLARSVESPWLVGISYGPIAASEADTAFLPGLLDLEERPIFQFVGGYVGSRFDASGWSWVDTLRLDGWSSALRGAFLSFLPFDEDTWLHVSAILGSDQHDYWSKTDASPYRAKGNLGIGVDRLLEYGRPRAALHCLHWMLHDKKAVDVARTVRALKAGVSSSEKHRSDAYEIVELIKALQDDPTTKSDSLGRIEWAYLPILDGHHGGKPRTLERRLAADPGFFCEVIRLTFRSTENEGPRAEISEATKAAALNAYGLLNHWRIPPGTKSDDSFDAEVIKSWMEDAKRESRESGHLEIAMQMVGHVLAYAPPDPDGLWIHRGAAVVLNGKDADDLRTGFRIELYNSRGVHWVDPAGAPERKLAAEYRAKADAVELAGFHRLAAVVRLLADEYDREAGELVSRHQSED
jgi:hypothetical protein